MQGCPTFQSDAFCLLIVFGWSMINKVLENLSEAWSIVQQVRTAGTAGLSDIIVLVLFLYFCMHQSVLQ